MALSPVLRTGAVVLLILGFADFALPPKPRQPEKVFLIDCSASVPNSVIRSWIARASGRIYLFAGNCIPLSEKQVSQIVQDVNEHKTLKELRSGLLMDECDAAATVSAAPAGSEIFIVTDGNNLHGEIPAIARLVRPDDFPEVFVRSLDMPPVIVRGEFTETSFVVESNAETRCSYSVVVDDRPVVSSSALAIKAGVNALPVALGPDLQTPGIHRIILNIEPESDTLKRNNMLEKHIYTSSSGAVLLVSAAGQDSPVVRLLTRQGFPFRVKNSFSEDAAAISPESFPLIIFEGLVQLNLADEEGLNRYLAGGGNVLFIPDDRTGIRSALERFLPFSFTTEKPPENATKPPQDGMQEAKVRAPSLAIAYVLDKSGSMAGKPLALVKESTLGSVKLLSEQDTVSVVAFDSAASVVVEYTSAKNLKSIEDLVQTIKADGGTNIFAGLSVASKCLSRVRAGGKHVIVMTDGVTVPGDFQTLISAMVQAGITISCVVVVVGEHDAALMSRIAEMGNGRVFYASSYEAVPQLFMKETILKIEEFRGKLKESAPGTGQNSQVQPDVEKKIQYSKVRIAAENEITSGLKNETFGPVGAPIGCALKESAVCILEFENKSPFLAARFSGAGRVLAMAAPVAEKTFAEFLESEGGSTAMNRMFKYLVGSTFSTPLSKRIWLRDNVIEVDARDARIDQVTRLPCDIALVPAESTTEFHLSKLEPGNEYVFRLTGPEGQSQIVPVFVPIETPRKIGVNHVFFAVQESAGSRVVDFQKALVQLKSTPPQGKQGWVIYIAAGFFLILLDLFFRRGND